MLRSRAMSLSLGIVVLPMTAVEGQTVAPRCESGGYTWVCALEAAGIPELRETRMGRREREIRYWLTYGNGFPEQLLVLRQHRDSVSGRLFLMWRPTMMSDSLARSLCLEQWSNARSGICVGRLGTVPDWGKLIRQLDAAGLALVPKAPVAEQPCDRTPVPPPPSDPDRLPGERFCAMHFDGGTEAIEVRTSAGYWRYQFPGIPDSMATGLKRDQALLRIRRQAARTRSVGAPSGPGAP